MQEPEGVAKEESLNNPFSFPNSLTATTERENATGPQHVFAAHTYPAFWINWPVSVLTGIPERCNRDIMPFFPFL